MGTCGGYDAVGVAKGGMRRRVVAANVSSIVSLRQGYVRIVRGVYGWLQRSQQPCDEIGLQCILALLFLLWVVRGSRWGVLRILVNVVLPVVVLPVLVVLIVVVIIHIQLGKCGVRLQCAAFT